MLDNITALILVIALIINLKEYRKMVKSNKEVAEILDEMTINREKLDRDCEKLYQSTKETIIDTAQAIKLSRKIIERYDKCIDKYNVYEKELGKIRNILNKSKRIRVKKKAAKRLIKGE